MDEDAAEMEVAAKEMAKDPVASYDHSKENYVSLAYVDANHPRLWSSLDEGPQSDMAHHFV